jgi:signal peptidase I
MKKHISKHAAKQVVKGQIREWAESIIIAVILALLIREFVVQAFKIPSGSMIPTFEIGDRIFVNKFIYGAKIPFTNIRLPQLRDPIRGDIIVFRSPETPKKDFVKRLIAFEGETVEIKEGNIYINGKAVDGPASVRSVYYYNVEPYGKEGYPVKVPKDAYFALGDNSANSRDSRYWGFIPKKNLIGKAIFIYWPITRMKAIK